jgi:hypothetical protein
MALVKRSGLDGSSESRTACVDACSSTLLSQVDYLHTDLRSSAEPVIRSIAILFSHKQRGSQTRAAKCLTVSVKVLLKYALHMQVRKTLRPKVAQLYLLLVSFLKSFHCPYPYPLDKSWHLHGIHCTTYY